MRITAGPALLKTAVVMLLQEVEYLLDLPAGTLAPPKVIEFRSLQIKQKK